MRKPMIRVVLDTNVFISAVLKPRSNPGLIFKFIRDGRIELIISPGILSEIERVMLYPKLMKIHHLPPKAIAEFIDNLEAFSLVVKPTMTLEIIQDDLSDNIFLECAVAGSADFIVSGDHHLKDLKIYDGIEIIDPATFLKIL